MRLSNIVFIFLRRFNYLFEQFCDPSLQQCKYFILYFTEMVKYCIMCGRVEVGVRMW